MPNRLTQKLSPSLRKPELAEEPDRHHRVIVEMYEQGAGRIANFVNVSQGKVHRRLKVIPALVVEMPYSNIQQLTISPHVKRIWHDTEVRAKLDVAVPTVGSAKAQQSGFTGKDMVAAIIDTGIHPHPDLTNPENRIIGWVDLVNERTAPYDDNGHGTHVAGIIAGNGFSSGKTYTGMAPEAKLVGVKVLDDSGSGNTSDVIAGIEWCIDNKTKYNIKAINMSLGSMAQDSYRVDPLCRAATAAWNNGLVVCIAAGNDGPDNGTINTPGINPSIITVGNLDDRGTIETDDDQISSSSSCGPTVDNLQKPDLLAPGADIMSLRVPRGYRTLSGTSMATAVATGAVLQVSQKNPGMNRVKLNAY